VGVIPKETTMTQDAAAKTAQDAAPKGSASAATGLDDDERAALDADIAVLQQGSRTWSALTVAQRVTLLHALRTSVAAAAEDWANTAADSKGLRPGHPLRGEEWLSGPYSVLGAIDAYADTLTKLSEGRGALDGVGIGRAPGGRTKVDAFPLTGIDRFLMSGFRARCGSSPTSPRTPHAARQASRS
jgi:hypothetical protein